jgi:hypothetical protein
VNDEMERDLKGSGLGLISRYYPSHLSGGIGKNYEIPQSA